MEIPKMFTDLIGTDQKFKGVRFKTTKSNEFKVLNARIGSGIIYDTKNMKPICHTVDLLLKNKDMKKAQWCRGFAAYELKINE